MLSNCSLLVGIVVIVAFATISAAQRSLYGEVCNNTQRCDRRSWLTCNSGKCECLKPDEMLFEPSTGKCASKAGERCKYALEQSNGRKSFEYTSCVENSLCGGDGFCTCSEDYYEIANGTCNLARNYSEPCDSKAKCSSLSGLACIENTCRCSERTSSYSPEAKQCVGLVGHVCIFSKCTQNATCSSNKCVCNHGFYQNSEDECSRRLDMFNNCTNDAQCKHEGGFTLKCVDGTCKCDPVTSLFGTGRKHRSKDGLYCVNSFNEFYPETRTQCLGKAGTSCIAGLCAAGSFCQYKYGCNKGPRTCVCRPGLSKSVFGTCGKAYYEHCDSAGACMDGLACDQGKNVCRCRYSNQDYDDRQRKCISPVGGPCDLYSSCGDGAECIKLRDNTWGSCQCKKGYVEGTFGTCEVAHGMPCKRGTVCAALAGLHCIDDICQCNGFKQFSPSSKRCVGLAGSECDPDTKSQQCVQNSNCLKAREEHTKGRCSCTTGFIVNANYTCELEILEGDILGNVPVLSVPVVYDVDTSDEGEESG